MNTSDGNSQTTERWEIVLRFDATAEQAAEVGQRVTRILRSAGLSIKPTVVAIMEDQP